MTGFRNEKASVDAAIAEGSLKRLGATMRRGRTKLMMGVAWKRDRAEAAENGFSEESRAIEAVTGASVKPPARVILLKPLAKTGKAVASLQDGSNAGNA